MPCTLQAFGRGFGAVVLATAPLWRPMPGQDRHNLAHHTHAGGYAPGRIAEEVMNPLPGYHLVDCLLMRANAH